MKFGEKVQNHSSKALMLTFFIKFSSLKIRRSNYDAVVKDRHCSEYARQFGAKKQQSCGSPNKKLEPYLPNAARSTMKQPSPKYIFLKSMKIL